jgi:predicted nucleic acid-binding protein
MPGRTAFFDTSAVVPLCLAQTSSQRARQAYRSFSGQVVARTTLIEAASVVHRAVRLGQLNTVRVKGAIDRLAQLDKRWIEMALTDAARALAVDILARYDLRAGDAIQLASALIWCKEHPRNRPFVCFDERLSSAAGGAGFDVIPGQ